MLTGKTLLISGYRLRKWRAIWEFIIQRFTAGCVHPNALSGSLFSASLDWPHLIELKGLARGRFTPKDSSLASHPVNVPLARPHPTASGVVSSAPLSLMDLETDQRLTGHAYVYCYTLIALKPITDLIEALQPLIQGDAVAPLVWLINLGVGEQRSKMRRSAFCSKSGVQ
jgi:hypothetical protein